MNKDSFLCQSLCGSFAGLAGGLVSQPFDTIKTRLQSGHGGSGLFRNLSKGIVNQIQVQIFCNSILFGTYEYSKNNIFGNKEQTVCYKSALLTGVLEGAIYSPIELMKVRKQLGLPSPTFRELSKGMNYCIMRESLGNCIYFSSYYHSKKILIDHDVRGDMSILISGGLSGIFYWLLIYPFDTLKTISQSGGSLRYSRLFKGLGVTMLRAVPVNCATFYGYEMALSKLSY